MKSETFHESSKLCKLHKRKHSLHQSADTEVTDLATITDQTCRIIVKTNSREAQLLTEDRISINYKGKEKKRPGN